MSWPVTLVVAVAGSGRFEYWCLSARLATWSREDATSSLVTGLPDPVGESALFLGLLPLRVGMYRLSTCPRSKETRHGPTPGETSRPFGSQAGRLDANRQPQRGSH